MKKTRVLVLIGLLIALDVILARFLSIQLPNVRIGFGFLPVAFSAILFGPIIGGISAALGDFIGMMIFPVGGAYFPGLTFSQFLTGIVYGLLLYNKTKTVSRITISVLIVTLIINLGLNTFWLSIIRNNPFLVILLERLLKEFVMFPIQIFLIHYLWKYVGFYIDSSLIGKSN